MTGPAFYAYMAPEPNGYGEQKSRPTGGQYQNKLREFVLMYDDVRIAADPKAMLLEFLQSTYEAAADAGKWDRKSLER